MTPTAGRILLYRLSEADANWINGQRNLGEPGNTATVGDIVPMMVIRGWSETCVNGQVFLDGADSLWATSVVEGDGRGQWRWPEHVTHAPMGEANAAADDGSAEALRKCDGCYKEFPVDGMEADGDRELCPSCMITAANVEQAPEDPQPIDERLEAASTDYQPAMTEQEVAGMPPDPTRNA